VPKENQSGAIVSAGLMTQAPTVKSGKLQEALGRLIVRSGCGDHQYRHRKFSEGSWTDVLFEVLRPSCQ
jgi:hypothetical protein